MTARPDPLDDTALIERLREMIHGRGCSKESPNPGLPCDCILGQAAARIEALSAQVAEQHKTLCFLGKWIERGLFDKNVSAKDALGVMAHLPGMPWNSERWDVDHKPYAAKYYAAFPKTALTESTPMQTEPTARGEVERVAKAISGHEARWNEIRPAAREMWRNCAKRAIAEIAHRPAPADDEGVVEEQTVRRWNDERGVYEYVRVRTPTQAAERALDAAVEWKRQISLAYMQGALDAHNIRPSDFSEAASDYVANLDLGFCGHPVEPPTKAAGRGGAIEQRHREAAAVRHGYGSWDDAIYWASGPARVEVEITAKALARFERTLTESQNP